MDAVTAMAVDGQEAFALIVNVLWTILRIGALLMALPLIGTHAVPKRVRVLLAGALALAIAPLLPPPPHWQGLDAALVLDIVREITLGLIIGLIVRLAFEAGALAGTLIATGSGLAFAQMSDPLRGVSSNVVGQWFYLAFGLVFFASDGHLKVVELVLYSYQQLPIGTALPDPSALPAAALGFFQPVLSAGVSLALPVMIALLAVNLAFGVLARAAPALNPIQLGLPISVLLGLLLMMILAGELTPPLRRLLDAAFESATNVTVMKLAVPSTVTSGTLSH